jgi:hypothetical protein
MDARSECGRTGMLPGVDNPDRTLATAVELVLVCARRFARNAERRFGKPS